MAKEIYYLTKQQPHSW